MRQLDIYVPTGESVEIAVKGDWVRLVTAAVTLRLDEPDAGHWLEMEQGDAVTLRAGFVRLKLTHSSGSGQTFTLLVGNGTTQDSAKIGGSVTVTGLPDEQGAYAQSTATVTNASGLLVAANAARRTLLISNQSATGNIYLNIAGAAATVAGGVKIAAGGVLLLDRYPPSGAIYAIGDIASNPSVIVAEG